MARLGESHTGIKRVFKSGWKYAIPHFRMLHCTRFSGGFGESEMLCKRSYLQAIMSILLPWAGRRYIRER